MTEKNAPWANITSAADGDLVCRLWCDVFGIQTRPRCERPYSMTGYKISLGKGVRIKDGRIVLTPVYRDASHAIAQRKSKKAKVIRKRT